MFVGEQRDLSKEECEEETALLPARGGWGDIAPANMESDVVAVWADQRVPLIALRLSGLIKRLRKTCCALARGFIRAVLLARQIVRFQVGFARRNLVVCCRKHRGERCEKRKAASDHL